MGFSHPDGEQHELYYSMLAALKKPVVFNLLDAVLHSELCEFSIYRGVLVQWDEDRDKRLLVYLDTLCSHILDQLLFIHENKGVIWMVWSGPVPKGYETDEEVYPPCGDMWGIAESTSVQDNIVPL